MASYASPKLTVGAARARRTSSSAADFASGNNWFERGRRGGLYFYFTDAIVAPHRPGVLPRETRALLARPTAPSSLWTVQLDVDIDLGRRRGSGGGGGGGASRARGPGRPVSLQGLPGASCASTVSNTNSSSRSRSASESADEHERHAGVAGQHLHVLHARAPGERLGRREPEREAELVAERGRLRQQAGEAAGGEVAS